MRVGIVGNVCKCRDTVWTKVFEVYVCNVVGPSSGGVFNCFVTLLVSSVVARVAVGSSGNCCLRLMMRLSSLYLGNLLMFA